MTRGEERGEPIPFMWGAGRLEMAGDMACGLVGLSVSG